ncbi:site-specific integrase [Pseudomonas siliginis]|uniref:site-specific integrase n=1 Tax=Pseudomonas siliginis TaxID=2842346 RepID=UPI0020924544|nr:site-specific integrase [Pseudomonas siliginis]UST75340.1 site-specific integrase [Pseudomonas siliginis]
MSRLFTGAASIRTTELKYKVIRFASGGVARHMLVCASTYEPCQSASLYEAAYSRGCRRYKSSIRTVLYHTAFLFTWAKNNNLDLDYMLMSGGGIGFRDVRKFANWLEGIIFSSIRGQQVSNYVCKILQSCSSFTVWFVENYTSLVSSDLISNVRFEDLINSHKKVWSRVMIEGEKEFIAPDLTDDELNKIDVFLVGRRAAGGKKASVYLRNYILWRLIKAFGLRIGEALALRLDDFNFTGHHPSFQIVRVDERGADYLDPRTPNNPLVKTFGRLLYFGPDDEGLIDLIDEYVADYRVKRCSVSGGVEVFINHDFLFVSHSSANSGAALSCSAASKIAKEISVNCVEGFHWHLLRHAVFNRLYEAASKLENNETEIDHIVYMGGWGNPESLKHYSKRAIRDRTRERLMRINQKGVKYEY